MPPLQSQRKARPTSAKDGLGKRSKSTFLKTCNIEPREAFSRKEPKKVSSNQTDESLKVKARRKKSSRQIDQSR